MSDSLHRIHFPFRNPVVIPWERGLEMLHQNFTRVIDSIGACLGFTAANPIDSETPDIPAEPRADSSLTRCLEALFLSADPYAYLYRSNGNNPTSSKALNKRQPVLKPTKGTGGVRDPSLVQGGGDEAGKK
ncbi:hypothetical protein F5B22DRAFT_628511, partial [Xylaria bambusicola]|uniref:uncharacterized protein n=1 Tax=Xylaria bambusicola TaxID=326684 RepID=UPI0020072EEF